MSLIPMVFSDWWEDLDRPHRIWDQHFGTAVDLEDLYDTDPFNSEILFYRPPPPLSRRGRRRYQPFHRGSKRRGRGVSTVQADKNKFEVNLDVSQFTPEEINVKVVDQNVVVDAKHAEKEDEHGWVSRQFIRKYIIPSQCDINKVESHLSSDHILTITVPRKEPLKSETNERTVKIQYTGKPALTNVSEEKQPNDAINSQMEEQTPQRGQQQPQQQQQQQQHQQQQRGRKGTIKAA